MARKITKNEQGLVAIIVTMIIMVVLSLIVVGFAQLARREQRQSLDRQLSTQAYYAAESGINIARDAILSGAYPSTTEKNSCGADSILTPDKLRLADNSNATVPCVLIDQSLERLEYSSIGQEATVIPLESETGNFSEISFNWQAKEGNASDFTCGTYPQLPAITSWQCDTGLLRVDLIPLPNGGNISRADLVQNAFTGFFYPGVGSGSVPFSDGSGPSRQGVVTQANCNTSNSPRYCRVTINGLNRQKYYARVTSIYKQSQLTIDGRVGSNAAVFVGAQAKIDVTGKAADVTRRVQVHIPSTEESQQYNFPTHALLSAESICKRLTVAPGVPAVVEQPSGTTTPACQITP